VLERATDLLAVAPLERAVPATRSRTGIIIGERTVPRRMVGVPIDPGPNGVMRAPWGEPDEPVPLVTIVTRRWPLGKPLPGRRPDLVVGIAPRSVDSGDSAGQSAVRGRRAARPARRRLLTRLAMVGLALIASLVAAELAGRGRPSVGPSRA
jgi:hypothetical protein